MSRRVLITGLGCVSPIGNSPDEVWGNVIAAKSGIRLLDEALSNGVPTVAGQCDFSSDAHFTRMQLSGMDRVSQLAVVAARQAIADAGLASLLLADAAIYMGCGLGGAAAIESAYQMHFAGRSRVSPLSVVAGMTNAAAAQIAMDNQIHGSAMTYSVACASSAIAIAEAANAIRAGVADVVIAGGAEALLNPGVIRAWQSMQTLATPDSFAPENSCQSFSATRSGLVLAEGSAVLILESEAHAMARGARVYGEWLGYGYSTDATHLTKPDVAGQIRAIDQALKRAKITADEVDYCNAHGTATKVGDSVEAQSLQASLGRHVMVSATKTLHGHLLGAAGALEALITVLGLWHQQMPLGLTPAAFDPECDLQLVTSNNMATLNAPQIAISNSFAFGGSNAVLVFKAA